MIMTTSPSIGPAREYIVLAVRFEPDHTEEHRAYAATSIDEALLKAEREDAGRAGYTYGIMPEDFAEARGAGIAFNEADGLLLDSEPRCTECGEPLEWTDLEAQDGLCGECARVRDLAERSRGEGPAR